MLRHEVQLEVEQEPPSAEKAPAQRDKSPSWHPMVKVLCDFGACRKVMDSPFNPGTGGDSDRMMGKALHYKIDMPAALEMNPGKIGGKRPPPGCGPSWSSRGTSIGLRRPVGGLAGRIRGPRGCLGGLVAYPWS